MLDITIDLGRNLKLKNPVMLASGTAGFGLNFSDFYNIDKLGGICTKGISIKPIEGNPTPRIVETNGGMINSIGLQNPGAEKFAHEILPELLKHDLAVVVNVFGYSLNEYIEVVEYLDSFEGIDGFEVNISCPNVKKGGIQFGTNCLMTGDLVSQLRKRTKKHLMFKLSPNVTDITEFATIAEAKGADSVSLINTLIGMAVNIETKQFLIARKMGGYSGPPIKPVALRMVWQVANKIKIPIIGIGGIENHKDALEFMLLGASAIQIGTANFYNPKLGGTMADEIGNFLKAKKYDNIKQWIGSMENE